MGSHTPLMSGRKVAQVFQRLGWEMARQRASHIIMVKPGEVVTLSIPGHKQVARGTLRGLIRTAGLTLQEFLDAAK